ncbi:MAG: helix-turn-helix domain-containing protein [Ferruginibacter sp.]|nr:helix-turn-helix domain-containing protein [Rhodoferax sp.]
MILPPSETTDFDRRDWIAGLEKGLALLESFSETHPRMNATQAAQRGGLTRTAARRYLLTLAHLGYVGTDGKLFWLTPRVLRLGQSYLDSARLPRIVQPFLQRVTASTTEVAYLSVLDGDDIVYIARNGPSRAMNIGYVLGGRVPAQVTAAGLLILAQRSAPDRDSWLAQRTLQTYTPHTITDKEELRTALAHIRAQDWALSEQQLEPSYRGIAVPVRDRNGDAVAALSVTMPMGHEPAGDAVARVLPVLREAAQAMRTLI